MSEVKIPNDAVGAGGDVLAPTTDLLQALNLLPSDSDLEKASSPLAAIGGPPASVAVLEGGAAAISKWWAAGLGVTVAGAWPTVISFWDGAPEPTKRTLILALTILTSAAAIAIGYIVGSDVRGRAAATVATLEARERLADRMIQSAAGAYQPPAATPKEAQVSPLATPLPARNGKKIGSDEDGWLAIAISVAADETTRVLLVNGAESEWLSASDVAFGAATR